MHNISKILFLPNVCDSIGARGDSQCAAFPWYICKGRSYNYFLLQIKQNDKFVCRLFLAKKMMLHLHVCDLQRIIKIFSSLRKWQNLMYLYIFITNHWCSSKFWPGRSSVGLIVSNFFFFYWNSSICVMLYSSRFVGRKSVGFWNMLKLTDQHF